MKWTKSQVIEFFDNNWNTTLNELASMSMWSVKELKEVLLTNKVDKEEIIELTSIVNSINNQLNK
jgi:hypothetical protein|tara:strand:+ start:999 stop:1193 length:195 start_codon:yes stop_codon:yes gene_type:complete